jgi:hypothetical protein
MPGLNFSNEGTNKIEILKAALPYMSHKSKKPLQFIIQAEELSASLKSMDDDSSISAFDLDENPPDIEAMLLHIKDLCSAADQDLINVILNFFKTQKLYQSYSMFMGNNSLNNKMNGMGLGGMGLGGMGLGDMGPGNSNSMLDFLMSQLTPDQKSTFETLSMMMSAMP